VGPVNDLKLRLKKLIVEALRLEDVDPASIPDDAPLFGGGPLNLDSVDALELVLEIERTFGIQLEDDTRTREFLRSVDTLAQFLAPILGEAQVSDAG
jgi:acyl carrier protein